MRPEIIARQSKWDETFNKHVADVDKAVASMSEAEKQAYLTQDVATQSAAVLADWQDLAIHLLVRYIDGQEKKVTPDGQFERTQHGEPAYPNRPACPEEHLRLIAPHTIHE